MRTPPSRALLAIALSGSAIAGGALASPASAAYQLTPCGNAAAGCNGSGSNLWREVRSQKDGPSVNSICAQLKATGGGTLIGTPCASNTTFVRNCYYGGSYSYGFYNGSGTWSLEGRASNGGDIRGC